MPAIEIRPRRATELVDAGFQLLRRFYPQLLTVSALAMAPGVFLRVAMRDQLSDQSAIVAHPGPVLGAAAVSLLCLFLANVVLIVAASDGYLEGNVDLARALGVGMRRAFWVAIATIVRYFAAMLVMIPAAILGGVFTALHVGFALIVVVPLAVWLWAYVLLRTFAVAPVVLLEGVGPFTALSRSWRLSEGCTAHTFFSLGLAYLLYFVIAIIANVLGLTLLTPSITAIISAVVIVPIYPLLVVVSTLLYYDLRVRKEGFDLEVMSRELGTGGAATPIPAV